MGNFAKAAIFLAVGLMLVTIFVPSFRQLIAKTFSNSETITLPGDEAAATGTSTGQ